MISMLIGKYKVFVCLCVFALDHSRPYTYASTYRSIFVCAYGCVELCVCVIMSSRRRIGVYLHTYMFRHTFGSVRVCVVRGFGICWSQWCSDFCVSLFAYFSAKVMLLLSIKNT